MITSYSEYEFVIGDNIDAEHPNGDIDRLPLGITGNIMPLRTGTLPSGMPARNQLVGEDIAFLQEAMCERMLVTNMAISPERWTEMQTFSRKVRSDILRAWCSESVLQVSRFLKYAPSAKYNLASSVADVYTFKSIDDLHWDYANYQPGSPLILSAMVDLFNDLRVISGATPFAAKTQTWNDSHTRFGHKDFDSSDPWEGTSDRCNGILFSQIKNVTEESTTGGYEWWYRRSVVDGATRLCTSPAFWGVVKFDVKYWEHDIQPTTFTFSAYDFVQFFAGGDHVLTLDQACWSQVFNALARKHVELGDIPAACLPGKELTNSGNLDISMKLERIDYIAALGDHTKWW